MTASLYRSAVALFLGWSLAVAAPLHAQAQTESQGQSQTQSQNQTQAPQSTSPPGPNTPQVQKTPSGSFVLSTLPDYSRGVSPFPAIFNPYKPIRVAEPTLTNSPTLDQLIHDGKLELSLEDAISLALENNLDIAIQRFTPWIADTDILRTLAGGVARGLGGTGTASALGSIPPATFDPIISGSFNVARQSVPVNNPFLTGVGSTSLTNLVNYNTNYNLTYSQAFHTGTTFSFGLASNRFSTTSPSSLFNPSVQPTGTIGVQQQLLNGFGILPNTRFILEARNSKKFANQQFTAQIITTVAQVQNFYWELVFARENVRVQGAAVKTSEKLYADNKKQVEIGTLAPIEVVRAESEAATDKQNLIVAQTVQLQQQTLLLNAITRNPMSPELIGVEIVPTDAIPSPPALDTLSLQDAVKEAWSKRPELKEAEYNLKNFGIEVRATRNALLPTLTAFGQISATGLGGNATTTTVTPTAFSANSGAPIVDAAGNPILVNGAEIFNSIVTAATISTTTTPGGIGDAFSQLFNGRFPSYIYGVNLTLPLRNRSAQADSARALLDERQAETSYRQMQNNVVVDVRNAQIALQQDTARVEAAQKARELAQQTIDAEQKKYQLGASTVFLVIQAQRDLTTAQGNELRAKVDLTEAQVAYNKAMGRTLDVNRISVADAGGHVHRSPSIPGTPEHGQDAFAAGGN